MIIPIAALLIVLVVTRAGTRLPRPGALRLGHGWLALLALALQVAVTGPLETLPEPVPAVLHVVSYAAVAAFVVVNRRIPGLAVVAAGGMANLLAISVNGGVMPASPRALQIAGLIVDTDAFNNSAPVAGARLAFLGDVIPIPSQLPFANVLSIGDLLILAGLGVLLSRACAVALTAPNRWLAVLGTPAEVRSVAGQVAGVNVVRAASLADVWWAAGRTPAPLAVLVAGPEELGAAKAMVRASEWRRAKVMRAERVHDLERRLSQVPRLRGTSRPAGGQLASSGGSSKVGEVVGVQA